MIELSTGRLRYCNAGHNPPYLLRMQGDQESLKPTGAAFGLDADMPYRIAETMLRPGDALFLFTDGITEAFDPAGAEFGTEVTVVETDASKLAALREGRMPIYEPGLSEMIQRNAKAGRLKFTSDLVGPVTITRSPTSNQFPLGTTTVTWTASSALPASTAS